MATPGDTYPNGYKGPDGKSRPGFDSEGRDGMTTLTAQAAQMEGFAQYLTRQVGRSVVDQTGLKDNYDFTLKWSPDENRATAGAGPEGADAPPAADNSGPSIFTAIQEQLGLKLESSRGPVEALVIDHVERPTENQEHWRAAINGNKRLAKAALLQNARKNAARKSFKCLLTKRRFGRPMDRLHQRWERRRIGVLPCR